MSKLQQYQQDLQRASNQALQEMNQPKIGAGALKAAGRMGHDEIGHALKAFPDSIPITPEVGALGEPTPQEVFADKQEVESPLQALQKDLYTPKLAPEKEMAK